MNKQLFFLIMLLVVGTVSVPVFADEDGYNDDKYEERYDEKYDDDRYERHHEEIQSGQYTHQDPRIDDMRERHLDHVSQLEKRITVLEEQIIQKDNVIIEQMKIILMLFEKLNLVQ